MPRAHASATAAAAALALLALAVPARAENVTAPAIFSGPLALEFAGVGSEPCRKMLPLRSHADYRPPPDGVSASVRFPAGAVSIAGDPCALADGGIFGVLESLPDEETGYAITANTARRLGTMKYTYAVRPDKGGSARCGKTLVREFLAMEPRETFKFPSSGNSPEIIMRKDLPYILFHMDFKDPPPEGDGVICLFQGRHGARSRAETQSSAPKTQQDAQGLGAGAIAGIAIGAVVLVPVIVGAIIVYTKRRRRRQPDVHLAGV